MSIRQLLSDDDAVSPVIGVILMVAITVILAAVIGAFVLGFGGGGPSAPQTSWDTSTPDNTTVEFALQSSGGDIDRGNLEASGPNASITSPSNGTISAGTTVDVDHTGNSSDTISIVWSDEGTSSTIAEHTLD